MMEKNFVFVEGGQLFKTKTYKGNFNETIHNIENFYISKFQVTQSLYIEILNQNPSNLKNDDHPVEMVSWYDAVNFCNKLSILNNLKPYYVIQKSKIHCSPDSNGFRLPTVDEWEYAARGGKKSNKYVYSGSNNLNSVAWYKNNSNGITHPVGLKEPNELELYDMSGNVWEWCFDEFDSATRTYKGGSFLDFDYGCTIEVCGHRPPDLQQIDIGFRLIKNIDKNPG